MSMMASQITILTIVYSKRRSKKTSKLHVTGLCEGNSPVTSEFPTQRASNAVSNTASDLISSQKSLPRTHVFLPCFPMLFVTLTGCLFLQVVPWSRLSPRSSGSSRPRGRKASTSREASSSVALSSTPPSGSGPRKSWPCYHLSASSKMDRSHVLRNNNTNPEWSTI